MSQEIRSLWFWLFKCFALRTSAFNPLSKYHIAWDITICFMILCSILVHSFQFFYLNYEIPNVLGLVLFGFQLVDLII